MSAQPLPIIESLRLSASQPTEQDQPTTHEERFKLTWADRVYEANEPLEFLVGDGNEGLITKGSVNLLVGDPGSGKTWAAIDLAVCVAMGKKWLDLATKQTAVLIVDEESGPRRLQRRIFETLNGHLIQRQ